MGEIALTLMILLLGALLRLLRDVVNILVGDIVLSVPFNLFLVCLPNRASISLLRLTPLPRPALRIAIKSFHTAHVHPPGRRVLTFSCRWVVLHSIIL